jgi:predicted TIM-barrel fold metal-dependent hydrolase
MSGPTAAKIRAELNHPVVDNDGHILEIHPVITDYVREEGGDAAAARYEKHALAHLQRQMGKKPFHSLDERLDAWIGQGSWWSWTVDTYDRATAMLPALMEERLGELGIDFSILYPSEGFVANRMEGDLELRAIACRAVNRYQADLLGGHGKHLTPVAVIPMGTPTEAIDELEYAVKTLGYKAAVFPSGARRPIPKIEREHPEVAELLYRFDFFGIDSAYDYDPVWAKCEELGIPVTFHGLFVGSNGPVSPTSNTFNRHAGIDTYSAVAAALLLGGVMQRFPKLTVAFQELGVGWACDLYSGLVSRWQKRSGAHIRDLDPAHLDLPRLIELVGRYGDDRSNAHLAWVENLTTDLVEPETVDEFADVGVDSAEGFRDLFTSRFFFGCEADDVTYVRAFSGNPLGAVLKTTFASDFGHWDARAADAVLPEAYELLEAEIVTPQQFRAFLLDNAVELYTSMNPQFFDGTALEDSLGSKAIKA